MTLANDLSSTGAPPVARTVPPARLLIGVMVAAAVLALTLATRAPLSTTVLGLIAFGVLHNVLEIRYVAGRFAALLTGRFLALLLGLITGIMLCRLAIGVWPVGARYAEIGLGYLILGVGSWIGLGRRWVWIALAVLALAATASFRFPGYHFVMLTHLHNLVPLIFLWDWARRIPDAWARAAFRLTQVVWVVAVPVLILAGGVDRWLTAGPGVVRQFVGDGSAVIAVSAPPQAASLVGLRFLVAFAFLQTMHYVVWVGFLPKFAPDAAAAFDARVPWLRGGRAWAFGLLGGAFLSLLFFSDYSQGKALYGALASYHAYLEFPVLLALLMHGAGVRDRLPQP
ncbi:hypothetical protein GCM10009841_24970 [Microlunatus panaciterrae]|uniref:Beta-carotene 15,15'-monooxygenase n=1 Tax=Microlunatus panaciterrae TaxID=400768 RepID=A0ABS2REG7_9ACTN|nr:hypothetical protein [Microlunatus panaciterrae]MBM7797379.1 hypothetical protein [Microlunatus panaciterrae]